jgi:AraC-like DNA-binding protein
LRLFISGWRILSFIIFCLGSELRSYQRAIKQLFSETTNINLKWASLLINGYLCLVIAGVIIFPLMFIYPDKAFLLLLIMMAIATPYIYIVTFKGISQPSLWQVQHNLKKEEIEQEFQEAEKLEVQIHNKEEYLTKVGENKFEPIVKNVLGLMEGEKLYHEAELTLQQLANRLQLPTYLVSQAINDGLKKNFYELINGYRVEEAKQLLLSPKNQNFTILSIGFEAGFNSKTTFNTVFKKFTGMTPTEFRDKQKTGVAAA